MPRIDVESVPALRDVGYQLPSIDRANSVSAAWARRAGSGIQASTR